MGIFSEKVLPKILKGKVSDKTIDFLKGKRILLTQPEMLDKAPNAKNYAHNVETANKLHDALGGSAADRPEYRLLDEAHPLESMAMPNYTVPQTGEVLHHKIHGSNEVSDFNNGILAHELGHDTSPIQHNNIANKIYVASKKILGNQKYQQLIDPLLRQTVGVRGNILLSLPDLVRLGEETQANVRAFKALKKVNGTVNKDNLKALLLSESSYLKELAVKNALGIAGNKLGFKPAVQRIRDRLG